MTRLFAAAAVLLAIAVVPTVQAAHAAEAPKYTPAYDRCMDGPSGQTTMGQIACGADELKIQDARLNRAYQGAMKRMDLPRQKTALQKAQRAWIAFRDADCASYLDADWGTLARVETNLCTVDRTIQRADELEAYRQSH